MSNNPKTLNTPQAIIFTFETAELNICRAIAKHWMKMYVCHELDRDLHPGLDFILVWNPLETLEKVKARRSFRTDRLQRGGYEFRFGAQKECELCEYELTMLFEMVSAAVEVRLNKFLLVDKGEMADVLGDRFTWSWASSVAAKNLKQKLDLLQYVAGMFTGHSMYQSTCIELTKLEGVEYAA